MITKSVILKMIAEIIERYDGKAIFASDIEKKGFLNSFLGKKHEVNSLDIYFDKDEPCA